MPAKSRRTTKPRADDWDEYEDPPVEALPGSPPSDVAPSATSELLLELTAAVTRLHVLMHEADEEEFKAIARRLRLFRRLVNELPERPSRPTKRIGFRLKNRR